MTFEELLDYLADCGRTHLRSKVINRDMGHAGYLLITLGDEDYEIGLGNFGDDGEIVELADGDYDELEVWQCSVGGYVIQIDPDNLDVFVDGDLMEPDDWEDMQIELVTADLPPDDEDDY